MKDQVRNRLQPVILETVEILADDDPPAVAVPGAGPPSGGSPVLVETGVEQADSLEPGRASNYYLSLAKLRCTEPTEPTIFDGGINGARRHRRGPADGRDRHEDDSSRAMSIGAKTSVPQAGGRGFYSLS